MTRRRHNRRAVHAVKRKASSRHHVVKVHDKHIGNKIHTRTVNAPKVW